MTDSLRVVDAEWDLRALGVSSAILTADGTTKSRHVSAAMANLNAQMITIRIPPGKGDLQDWLQGNGFTFREIQFVFESPQEQPEQVRRLGRPEVTVGANPHIDTAVSWLEGGVIAADRISIDARFGPEASGRRFAQLLRDEISVGASLKMVMCKSEPVGWFCIRTLNKSPHVALSGVNPDTTNPAAGLLLHKAILDEVMTSHSNPLRSTVSSINLGALRAHQYFGYNIVKIEEIYVLLKP